MMASVSGTRMLSRLPRPGSESISTVPLSWPMRVLTTSMPTPRPDTSDISSLVEKPAAKIRL